MGSILKEVRGNGKQSVGSAAPAVFYRGFRRRLGIINIVIAGDTVAISINVYRDYIVIEKRNLQHCTDAVSNWD